MSSYLSSTIPMNIKYFFFSILFLFSSLLQAQTEIQNLRVIAPIPGQDISAGYLVLKNNAAASIELVSVETESADRVQIHTHQMDNGMMRMVQLDSLSVEPGAQAEFKRGGLHLMIFSPDAQALESGSLDMRFNFSDGTSIHSEARVEQLMPGSGGMNHQNHQH